MLLGCAVVSVLDDLFVIDLKECYNIVWYFVLVSLCNWGRTVCTGIRPTVNGGGGGKGSI